MKLKLGNSVNLRFLAKDQDGDIITNLSTATDIIFLIKINPTDNNSLAIISKNLSNGITVDTPSQGYIQVQIESSDFFGILAGNYYFGLQIEYPTSKIYELSVTENDCESQLVSIIQDVVN